MTTKAKPSKSKKQKSFRLLGKSAGALPQQPERTILETFPNRTTGRNYWIQFDCSEFTSLCPVTGQPDFATLKISYIPGALCIETKSLKFYLASFRNTHAFNEEIVNRILDDLIAVCSPVEMVVHGEFSPRGGIRVTTDAFYPEAPSLREW